MADTEDLEAVRGGSTSANTRRLRKKQPLDLAGVDLRKVDLTGMNLHGAFLQGSELSEMTLYGTVLNKTDLRGASLIGTVFRQVSLVGAKLQGSDLRRSVLDRVCLRGANLTNADIRGVDVSQITSAKWAEMKGLEHIIGLPRGVLADAVAAGYQVGEDKPAPEEGS